MNCITETLLGLFYSSVGICRIVAGCSPDSACFIAASQRLIRHRRCPGGGVCGEFVSRAQLAVFTWQGCTLSVTGDPNYCYVGTTTPMRSYINLHAFLQVRNPPSP